MGLVEGRRAKRRRESLWMRRKRISFEFYCILPSSWILKLSPLLRPLSKLQIVGAWVPLIYIPRNKFFFVSLDVGNYNEKGTIKWINGLFAKLLLFRSLSSVKLWALFYWPTAISATCYCKPALGDSIQENNHKKIYESSSPLVVHNYKRKRYSVEGIWNQSA